ncbi:hypothetical protein [Bacillus sp. EB600]|nr:hypothetical protein [Bacillus sp. EB600]
MHQNIDKIIDRLINEFYCAAATNGLGSFFGLKKFSSVTERCNHN